MCSGGITNFVVVTDADMALLETVGVKHMKPWRLGARTSIQDQMCNVPDMSTVMRLRRAHAIRRARRIAPVAERAAPNHALLEVPVGFAAGQGGGDQDKDEAERKLDRKDPVKMIRAMGFASFLRSGKEFNDAGMAWEEYKHDKAPLPEEMEP